MHAGGDARVGAAVLGVADAGGLVVDVAGGRRPQPGHAGNSGLEAADGRAQRVVRGGRPLADGEDLADRERAGLVDLGVRAGARLVAEAPERDPVVGGERRAAPAGRPGSSSCARVGTTHRGVGRPTVIRTPPGPRQRAADERRPR